MRSILLGRMYSILWGQLADDLILVLRMLLQLGMFYDRDRERLMYFISSKEDSDMIVDESPELIYVQKLNITLLFAYLKNN
jgi:hypothetical protein